MTIGCRGYTLTEVKKHKGKHIVVSDEVHLKLKNYCATAQKQLKEVCESAIEEYLAKYATKETPEEVPDAPATDAGPPA